LKEFHSGAANQTAIVENSKDLVDQHEKLVSDLESFLKLSQEKNPTPETIQNIKILDQEINSVTSREMLSHIPDADFKTLMGNIMAENKKEPPQSSLVYLVTHMTPEEKSFLPLPWIVRVFLFPMWAKKFQKVWRFASNACRNSSNKIVLPIN